MGMDRDVTFLKKDSQTTLAQNAGIMCWTRPLYNNVNEFVLGVKDNLYI